MPVFTSCRFAHIHQYSVTCIIDRFFRPFIPISMSVVISPPEVEKDIIFQKNWETYQVVLRENYNQHTKLYAQLPDYLSARFPGSFSILDLGCGDVDYFSKALLKNNLWSRVATYTGVDLSAQAMEIGEKNVRQVAPPGAEVSFVVAEMLSFVKKMPSTSYDLVFSSLAIHHLQDTDKEQLIHEIRRVIKRNGVLVLIDIFLDEEEDRPGFVQEIGFHIRQDWVKLSSQQTESIIHHMSNFDFPAKFSTYKHWASTDPHYKEVKCLESIRFYKTIVLEVD